MRISYRYLIRATVALGGLGVVCGQTPAPFPFPRAGAGSSTGAAKPVQVVDPVVRMKAYSWTIPAKWIFEGTVMNGTSCVDTPFPVVRMISPDPAAPHCRCPVHVSSMRSTYYCILLANVEFNTLLSLSANARTPSEPPAAAHRTTSSVAPLHAMHDYAA